MWPHANLAPRNRNRVNLVVAIGVAVILVLVSAPAVAKDPHLPGTTYDRSDSLPPPNAITEFSAASEEIGTTVPAMTLTLFATRIGLVGNRTANGHLVGDRDHFVALPSRRGLNVTDGATSYQVQLCYDPNGRCETAPVYDVGPWNIQDDYWNPGTAREQWQDLPHGMPQAQAAKSLGYNNGLDGFGRQVQNPAGIDLADGTYWDGLALPTNDWVNVTFLFTGGVVSGVRTDDTALNVRVGPDTTSTISRTAAAGSTVILNCETTGSLVAGTMQTTDHWYRVSGGGYVSGGYVDAGGAAPAWC